MCVTTWSCAQARVFDMMLIDEIYIWQQACPKLFAPYVCSVNSPHFLWRSLCLPFVFVPLPTAGRLPIFINNSTRGETFG